MDSDYQKNADNEMWYGGMATGKRIPEIYSLSPNLDADGDNIMDDAKKGIITRDIGPEKRTSFIPLITNSITLFRLLVIITLLGIASLGGFISTLGCKGEYLQLKWGWVSQFALFCIILINMFIAVEDSRTENTSTYGIMVGAFLTWTLLNIVAKVGDSWLFFSSPFWPTPLTYWGGVMLMCVAIYALEQHRTFWLQSKSETNMDMAEKRINLYETIEYILVLLFSFITIWRFGVETTREKKRLGNKFSFIKFFLGMTTVDKKNQQYALNRSEGKCKNHINKKLIKEINKGIKNSPWTKFKNTLFSA